MPKPCDDDGDTDNRPDCDDNVHLNTGLDASTALQSQCSSAAAVDRVSAPDHEAGAAGFDGSVARCGDDETTSADPAKDAAAGCVFDDDEYDDDDFSEEEFE